MTIHSSRIGKISICAGILVASAAFFLAGVFNPPQMIVAGAPGAASGSPVSAINIEPKITPNPVTVGEVVTAGGTISIVGGPAQVTFTITSPVAGGGSCEGSFEMPLDENGLWGFTAPPFRCDMPPGTYSFTLKAEAEGVSETKTITFTINPGE